MFITYLINVEWHPLGHTISFLAQPSALLYVSAHVLWEHSSEWDSLYTLSYAHHICNAPDDDKQSLPDADTHLALCPDEDDGDNIALSSFVRYVSLVLSCS